MLYRGENLRNPTFGKKNAEVRSEMGVLPSFLLFDDIKWKNNSIFAKFLFPFDS